jgi:hypothetical protein
VTLAKLQCAYCGRTGSYRVVGTDHLCLNRARCRAKRQAENRRLDRAIAKAKDAA